jgi:hypothetical protein
MTFQTIIDKFGVQPLAKVLSVDESHVRTMKARDSIPPEYWGRIVDAAQSLGIEGVTHESLLTTRLSRFARNSGAEQSESAA